MAAEQEDLRDTVSREAHERVKQENAALKQQLEEAKAALTDLQKVEAARRYFAEKGADQADVKAEFVLPHLRDVEDLSKIPEVLGSDRFQFLLTQPAPSSSEPDDEGSSTETAEQPPVDPGQGGFAGVNPGGREAPPKEGQLTIQSPEFRAAVARNDHEQLQKWYEEGRIAEPARPY